MQIVYRAHDGVILADEVEQLERFAIADLTARRDAGEEVSLLRDSYVLAFDQIWIRADASTDPALNAAREHRGGLCPMRLAQTPALDTLSLSAVLMCPAKM
jgi:hypothetical protein